MLFIENKIEALLGPLATFSSAFLPLRWLEVIAVAIISFIVLICSAKALGFRSKYTWLTPSAVFLILNMLVPLVIPQDQRPDTAGQTAASSAVPARDAV